MTMQDETTPVPFYVAAAGHQFMPGETFPNISANPVEGLTKCRDSAEASHWVALHPDGSRTVVDFTRFITYADTHYQAQRLLDDNPGSTVHYIRHPGTQTAELFHSRIPVPPRFTLATLGTYPHEPVNQVPFLNIWKPFVARSAHEFDWTMGAHSLAGLSENEQWTIQHQMYGLISAPWILMLLLESTSPTAESVSGNLLWKTYQASVEEVLTGLCHECEDIATFARRFAHKANLELFRGALVQGKVYESDRDVTPWGLSDNIVTQAVAPAGQTPTAEKIAQFHRQSRSEFLNALAHYDTVVGASERPHSHD